MTKPTTGRVAPRHHRPSTPPERVPPSPPRDPATRPHDTAPGPQPARRAHRPPTAEESEQMAGDALLTSMFSGIFLIVATILFGLVGGTLLKLGGRLGGLQGAKIGLGVGLALTVLVVTLVLRRYSERIKLRSRNLYRGMWLGMWISLAIMVVMAYLPHLVFPQYCPPGAPCEFQQSQPVTS